MKIKGIYHAHSTYSHDGHFSLRELKESLCKQGFHFAIMTEHAEDLTPESYTSYYTECMQLSDTSFLFIPGLEVPYEGKVHVGCFPGKPTYEQVPMYREGINVMHMNGALTIFHHPSKQNYYMNQSFREILDGVEIWNSRYEGKFAPSMQTMRFAYTHFNKNLFFGGLDLHSHKQYGGTAIELEVETCTTEQIMTTLRRHQFSLIGPYYRFNHTNFKHFPHQVWYNIIRTLYVFTHYLRDIIHKI